RAGRLLGHVRAAVAEAVGLPVAALDAEAPIAHTGLDSLAAVQLRARLAAALDVTFPLASLLAGSPRSLSAALLAALDARAPAAPANVAAPAPAAAPAPPATRGRAAGAALVP